MSGRTKIKRDGVWITGYRKTDRRNVRSRPTKPALGTITFQLPAELAWSTSPGKYGYFVQVHEQGVVTVTSYGGNAHLKNLARRFIKQISAGQNVDPSAIEMRATDQVPLR